MKLIFAILKDSGGVYAALSNGAGFRGAVIGLIDSAYKEIIKNKIDDIYPQKYPNINTK